MSTSVVPGVVAVVLVSLATLAIGTWGLRISRTTSDFFVASRTVRPGLNASAIGGEYLSAASFLGVAGLLFTFGAEMLWYPVGWTAGYLVLLVLVAAPLRRSGAYTLPDFAEARLGSRGVRALCSVLVVGIGWLYLLPQFQGAGVTLEATIGAPPWAGSLVVALVVLASVSPGGMRSITFVQAFQFWLKLTALLVPVFILLASGRATAAPTRRRWPRGRGRSPSPRPAAASGSTRRTRSSSRRSSARWACRTSSSASTPTPTAAPRVVRRSWCSGCWGSSTSCRRCTPRSAASTPRSCSTRGPT
jgi:cation/acetate symporter